MLEPFLSLFVELDRKSCCCTKMVSWLAWIYLAYRIAFWVCGSFSTTLLETVANSTQTLYNNHTLCHFAPPIRIFTLLLGVKGLDQTRIGMARFQYFYISLLVAIYF